MREGRKKTLFPLPGRPPLWIGLVLAGVACTPRGETGFTVETRDSAGVTIVENRGKLDPAGTEWKISPTPEVSIGTFQGDSLQQLYGVQGATRLGDGKIAVANAGSGQIRIFDFDGHFLRSLGRSGDGPGEFRQPILAGVRGRDTLVVVDATLRRLTYLHVNEGYLGSETMSDEVGGGVYPTGILPGGDVVVGGGIVFSGAPGQQMTGGYSRQETSYASVDPGGNLVTNFGNFPGPEIFMEIKNEAGAVSMRARPVPFGKHPMATAGPGGFFFGSGDDWSVQVYSPDGKMKKVFRLDRPRQAVGSGDLEAFVADQVEELTDPSEAQDVRQAYAEMPTPDFTPAFDGLVLDSRGDLWVQRFRARGGVPPEFDILDPQGSLVGWAQLPEEATVLEVGADYVLALYRDDLGVEYVKAYRLDRPAM